MTDYKSMFEQAVRTLAAIDRAHEPHRHRGALL